MTGLDPVPAMVAAGGMSLGGAALLGLSLHSRPGLWGVAGAALAAAAAWIHPIGLFAPVPAALILAFCPSATTERVARRVAPLILIAVGLPVIAGLRGDARLILAIRSWSLGGVANRVAIAGAETDLADLPAVDPAVFAAIPALQPTATVFLAVDESSFQNGTKAVDRVATTALRGPPRNLRVVVFPAMAITTSSVADIEKIGFVPDRDRTFLFRRLDGRDVLADLQWEGEVSPLAGTPWERPEPRVDGDVVTNSFPFSNPIIAHAWWARARSVPGAAALELETFLGGEVRFKTRSDAMTGLASAWLTPGRRAKLEVELVLRPTSAQPASPGRVVLIGRNQDVIGSGTLTWGDGGLAHGEVEYPDASSGPIRLLIQPTTEAATIAIAEIRVTGPRTSAESRPESRAETR